MKTRFKYAAAFAVCIALALGAWFWSSRPAALQPETPIATASSTPPGTPSSHGPLYSYIEIINSCGPYFDGGCVNLRSGPGTNFPAVGQARNSMVLKVASTTVVDGRTWYEIGFDGEIHYPERVKGSWYVAGDFARLFQDPGELYSSKGLNASTTKRIEIDLATQMLYAFQGETLFMQQPISTGLESTPTPSGTFWIYRKLPDSYMQGPIAGLSDQYYDLPGVPWDLYFTKSGSAIHGAYWHNHFGQEWSHGCVNLPPDQAKILYKWADLGTPVIVKQ